MTLWESGPLEPEHNLEDFDCAIESLNRWLIQSARRVDADRIAKVHVWTPPDSHTVMAYYALIPTAVARQELTSAQSKGSNPVPGFLLAKMALHKDLHGQGLGGELLLDALSTIIEASDRGGGRVIVVDAINESAGRFYQHYGFKPVKDVDQRLVMTVADARKSLGMRSLSISTDDQVGSMSMVYKGPDGQSVPFVGDAREVRLIAEKLTAIVATHQAADDMDPKIDLRAAIIEALNRDPFAP